MRAKAAKAILLAKPTAETRVPKLVILSATIQSPNAGKLTAGFNKQGEPPGDPAITLDISSDQVVEVNQTLHPFLSETAGTYVLWAKLGAIDISPSDGSVEVDGTDDKSANSTGGDLRGLTWDPEFAKNTAWGTFPFLILLSVLIAIAVVHRIDSNLSPKEVAGLVSLLLVLIGAWVVVVSVWLVALEMRGRASIPKDALEARWEKAVEAAAKFVAAVGGLRSPIAALVMGVVILAGAVWLSEAVANPVEQTTTTTTTTVAQTEPTATSLP